MSSLTSCIQKVGAKLDPADKAAVLSRSRELRMLAKERGEALGATEAAQQAVKDVIGEIRATLKAAEPAKPAAQRTKHPKTVMGSELLAIVSDRLGGLDPSLLSEYSVYVPTGTTYKDGKPRMEWRNPMIPGVGKLFRRGGRQDRQEIAQVLEDADYLEPGAVAADYKEAGERAKDLIKAALDRNIPKTLAEQQADLQASQEADRQAYYEALDEESAIEADAERAAIMAEASLGRVEMDAVDDADLFNMAGGQTGAEAMRAFGFSEQEIADELAREAGAQAETAQAGAGQDAQAPAGAAPAAGPAGVDAAQPGPEQAAEGLTPPEDDYFTQLFGTPEEQAASQARADAAAQAKSRDMAAVRNAIAAQKKRAKAEHDDWAGRVYKKNKTQVDLPGDGPSSQASMSIGSINESRRRNAMDALAQEIAALEKLGEAVSTDTGAERVLSNLRDLMGKAERAVASGNWPNTTVDGMFESMLLDDLKFRGPGGKGNVTSNGLSKAMLSAIKPAPALTLEAQTPADLKAKATREKAAADADKAEQKRLKQKAKADAEVADFRLEGSDRPADVAAAAGQGDIFDQPAEPAAPDNAAAQTEPAPMPAVGGISMALAEQAHRGTSFTPERRAEQERDSFMGALREAWERAARAAGQDPAAIERITEVFKDVADGYRERYTATLQARSRVMSSMIAGPARFPVERNRKRLETEQKRAEEAHQYLGRGIKRLLRAARGPIDNSPESELERVRLNLTQREEAQEQMKAANAALRKGDDEALAELGFSDAQLAELKKPDFAGRTGFPDYKLTNNNAEIRRLRERLQSAETRLAEAAAGPVETERQGVRMVEDATDDRLRLIFDGKPGEDVRNDLKANGFKWSPKNEAWQRQLTDNARAAAKQVLNKHYPLEDGQPVLSQAPTLKQGTTRGVPLSTLKPHIDGITAKMQGLRNTVEVVGTVTDLPKGIVDSLRSMNALGTVRGLRMPDGRVFLVADKLDSQLEAEFVLFHEVFGHEGLRAILTGEEYARAMSLVRLSNKAVAAEAAQWMDAYGDDQIDARIQAGMTPEAARREVRLLAVEEALADRAGKNDPPAVWKNVMAILQKALRRLGMDDLANWLENRTEAETYALLMQARKAITEGRVHALKTLPEGMAATSQEPADSGIITVQKIPYDDLWVVSRKAPNGSQHVGYYRSESEANEAAERERTDAKRAPGAGSRWWIENPAEPVQSAGGSRLDSLGRARAVKATLDARAQSIKSRAEGLPLEQLPDRAGFCFKLAAEASAAGIGDMVIGRYENDGAPLWHAVVMRDGMVYDPTFGKWFEAGVYEDLGFASALTLPPAAVRDYIAKTGGKAPDARNQGLGNAPPALSRRPPPLAPAVTVQPDENGNPEFAGDGVVLAYPQPAERFDFIPGPGQRLLNYAIMPAEGFDSLGFVELVVEDGQVTALMDIEITGAGRRAGIGRKVIETLLAANPEADISISNIVHQARGFWEKMGVPQQNLEDGAAYDGTLNWQAYAQAANDGRAAQVGQGLRGQAGRDDGRRQGADRRAEGDAQAPVLSQRDPTQTPAFKRWFGDSVVTKDGKPGGVPLAVYHGTTGNFTQFDLQRGGAVTGAADAREGFFFASNPKAADQFTWKAGEKIGSIMPVYLSIQNPAYSDLVLTGGNGRAAAMQIKDAKAAGHDGMIFRDSDMLDHRGQVLVAFRPEQIKSAISNSTFDPSNPSILLSQKLKTEAGWAMPEGSRFDNFVYKFQDKNVDLKRTIGAIKQGGDIADHIDAYLQEELFHGRAAKRTQDFVKTELDPLLREMALRGIKQDELDHYLHARHAEEANKLIAERNKLPDEGQMGIDGKVIVSPLQDGGSGMLTADARKYLAELDPDQKRRLKALAAKVDAILERTRMLHVAYGLVSHQEVDGWASMFKHYVPLFREDKDTGMGGLGTGQGFSIKGPETKSRTGSTAKVVDILANIALAREKAIVRGEKNRVAVAVAGLAKANPNEDIWTFGPVTERRYNKATDSVEVQIKGNWKNANNVLVAKVRDSKGAIQEVGVVFNERDERAVRMATALKNLDAAHLEDWLAMAAKITRYFSAINTQYNPIFGFVNLVRDVQSAAINLTSTAIAGHRAEVLKNIPAALRAVYRTERGKPAANKAMADLWEDLQREGGMTGFRDLYRTSNERAEAIRFAMNPTAWMDGTMGKFFTLGGALKVPLAVAQKGATKVFQWLSDYNQAMEGATRLAAYKVALDQGLTKQRAASVAKNITVNFNRKGQAGAQAGALYAFFNASVQGTARMGEVMFDNKDGLGPKITSAGLKIIGGGVLLGSLQALALAAAGFDDDEPPQFVREKNLIIPTGFLTDSKDYISIPMPLGWHVFPNLGRIATEFAMGGFKDPGKRAWQTMGVFAESFNPVGSAGVSLQTLSPTALDPLVALVENRDWTGKPIARRTFNEATPGFKNAKDTASSPAKWIAEAINWMSGGTKHQAGALSPTPDQLDYLWGQLTGGVGREFGKAEQTVSALVSGEDLPPHKVPLVGRFYGNAEASSSQGNRFYENVKRMNLHEAQVKGMADDWRRAKGLDKIAATEAYKDYLKQNPEVALIREANKAERQVQQLRKEMRQLVQRDAPRAEVKKKEAEITKAMRLFNEAMRSKTEPQKAPAVEKEPA